MLRIKFLLPFLLIAVFITVAAFTQIGKSKTTIKKQDTKLDYAYWFQYTGPTTQPIYFSDYTDPNNYVLLEDQNPYELCEYGEDALCAVLTERTWNGFSWKPDFSNQSYASAYWGLYNFYTSGLPATAAVHLKAQ